MDSYALLIILRIVHIAGGIFWVGSALFMAFFLFPSIKEAGPQGGRITQLLMQKRKLPIYMNTAAGLAVLSGFWLYWRATSSSPGWGGTRQGMIFGLGGLCGLLALIAGNAINSRTARKMASVGAEIQKSGGPPSPEQSALLEQLQKRMGVGFIITTTLLIVAVVCMSIARYI